MRPRNNTSHHQNTTSQSLFTRPFDKAAAASLLFLCFIFALLFQSQTIKAQIASIISEDGDGILGISSLMNATISNDVDAVNFFSKSGVTVVNQKNIGGATSLHIAARNGNVQIAKILIDNGANVNAIDNEGWTPLMRATTSGNSELVGMLLDHGADASKVNSVGETAIIQAASSGCDECLNILFSKYKFAENIDAITLKQQIDKASLIAFNKNNIPGQSILKEYLASHQTVYNLQNQNSGGLSGNEQTKPVFVVKSLDDKTPVQSQSKNSKTIYKFISNPSSEFKNKSEISGEGKKYNFHQADQQPPAIPVKTPTIPVKKEIKFKILVDKYRNQPNKQDASTDNSNGINTNQTQSEEPIKTKENTTNKKFIFKKTPQESVSTPKPQSANNLYPNPGTTTPQDTTLNVKTEDFKQEMSNTNSETKTKKFIFKKSN